MTPRLRYHVDAVGAGARGGAMGWAFCEQADIVALRLGGIRADHGLPRPDVARAFGGNERAARSGFVVRGVVADRTTSLEAELSDGRKVAGQIGRHFSGTTVALKPRPGFDFSFMEAILRVCAEQPRPLPRLDAPVLVIAPVYGGLPYLRPFFDSLLRTVTAPHRLAVVDDGNTDPTVRAILAKVAGGDGVTVIRREHNGGFVEAITSGFALWQGENVVLLNTDTVLPRGWLERLVAPLDRDPAVASTTPFSNCASICGFPAMPGDNRLFLGLDPERIDDACRRLEPTLLLPIPTGVGFCMGMSRHALARIGFVEQQTFGTGYGEENDWCRKAMAAGFVNVQAANLFVPHIHGGSFPSEQKRRQMERNQAILHQRYPDYAGDIAELILADPLSELRGFLSFLLAAEHHPDGVVLVVRGEVSDRKVEQAVEQAAGAGRPLLLANLATNALDWRYNLLWPGGGLSLSGGNLAELGGVMRRIRVGQVVSGQLSDCWSPEATGRAVKRLSP